MEKMLSVKDLRTQFFTREGTVRAVNGISLDFEEGETLGIVGESGCGKTVSMLSILRLIPQPPASWINLEKKIVKKTERSIGDNRIRLCWYVRIHHYFHLRHWGVVQWQHTGL